MPTETDLREALNTLAEQAPTSCAIGSRPVTPARTGAGRARTMALPVLAAAAVAAVVISVPALLHGHSGPSAAPQRATTQPAASVHTVAPVTAPLPAAAYVFAVGPVPGLTVHDAYTASGAQAIGLGRDGQLYATVVLYAPGGWVPPRGSGAVDVTVNGHPGFYGDTVFSDDGRPPAQAKEQIGPDPDQRHGALAWQYQPGAWAMVSTLPAGGSGAGSLTRAEALRIAETVRVGGHRPIAVPARFGYLPAGLQLQGVQSYSGTQPPNAPNGTQPRYVPEAAYSFGPAGTDEVTLTVGISADGGTGQPVLGDSVRVGGFHGDYAANVHDLELTNGTVAVAVSGLVDDGTGPRLPTEAGDSAARLAELERIVRGLSFAANLADRSTWFPASTAVD